MSNKTKILDTWEKHKKNFQYHSFQKDGSYGFIAINYMQQPAKWMMLLTKNNELRGYKGYSENTNSIEDIINCMIKSIYHQMKPCVCLEYLETLINHWLKNQSMLLKTH